MTNGDEEPTTGPLEIPAGRSVLFVYSHAAGPDWVPLTTLDSRSTRLEGVTSLTAANNLDLGPVSLKAQQLVAAGQERGHLAFYGAGGLLDGKQALTFDAAAETLHVPKLNVAQVDSSGVDFMGSPVKNVRIESGSASGLSVVRTASLFVEDLGETGQVMVAATGGGVASARDVYVRYVDSDAYGSGTFESYLHRHLYHLQKQKRKVVVDGTGQRVKEGLVHC